MHVWYVVWICGVCVCVCVCVLAGMFESDFDYNFWNLPFRRTARPSLRQGVASSLDQQQGQQMLGGSSLPHHQGGSSLGRHRKPTTPRPRKAAPLLLVSSFLLAPHPQDFHLVVQNQLLQLPSLQGLTSGLAHQLKTRLLKTLVLCLANQQQQQQLLRRRSRNPVLVCSSSCWWAMSHRERRSNKNPSLAQDPRGPLLVPRMVPSHQVFRPGLVRWRPLPVKRARTGRRRQGFSSRSTCRNSSSNPPHPGHRRWTNTVSTSTGWDCFFHLFPPPPPPLSLPSSLSLYWIFFKQPWILSSKPSYQSHHNCHCHLTESFHSVFWVHLLLIRVVFSPIITVVIVIILLALM